MNILLVLAGGGIVGLIVKIAVAAVVIWGIIAIVQWLCSKYGWTIPQPVIIILIVLGSILVIYWLYELFLQLS